MTSFISSFNLGREEMLIEEYLQLAWKEIAEYNVGELVDLPWDIEIHLGLDLNKEPMEGNDVDD